MKLEDVIHRVMELLQDSEIRKELDKGLKIQLTIGKGKTKVIALRPEAVRKRGSGRSSSA